MPAIVAVFVVRKLGEAAARDLLLRGRLIDAAHAAQIGLVTRAVPAGDLDAETDALCHELATETSASAVALTKRLLADVPSMGVSEGLGYARPPQRARPVDRRLPRRRRRVPGQDGPAVADGGRAAMHRRTALP